MSISSNYVPAKILVYITFVVILTAGMREIATILTTILFSVFVALIFTPPIRGSNEREFLMD